MRRTPVSSRAPTRSQRSQWTICTPGPAQRPPARGHGGSGGFEYPPTGAPPQGAAQDGQRASLSGSPRRSGGEAGAAGRCGDASGA
eukprot:4927153-Alexandrium_andersonii.AAC.1